MVEAGGGAVDLPEGAAEAQDLRPWPSGRGVVWRSEDWLYRWDTRSVRPIGRCNAGDSWLVGPAGAVLVGRDGEWTAGAARRGSVSPLPTPITIDPWGVRFDDDGAEVAGIGTAGDHVRVDLVGGRLLARTVGSLPLDAGTGALVGDTVRVHGAIRFRGVGEHTWALGGAQLAGPAGVVWDLVSGTPRFSNPVVKLGATAATGGLWVTIDWEHGDGAWFDPATGAITSRFRIQLAEGDMIEAATAVAGIGYARTSIGRVYAIDAGKVEHVQEYPDPVELGDRGDRWQIVPNGIRVDGYGLVRVPVEAAATIGGRVWAWNTDGLLVAFAV
jgi:hypothetical protein